MRVFLTPSTAISKLCSLINADAEAFLWSTGDIQRWHPVRQPPICQLIGYPKIFNTQPLKLATRDCFASWPSSAYHCFIVFILVEQGVFYCCIDNEVQLMPPAGVAFFVALCDILIVTVFWNLPEIMNCILQQNALGSLSLHTGLPAVLIRNEFMFISNVDNRSWSHVSFYIIEILNLSWL